MGSPFLNDAAAGFVAVASESPLVTFAPECSMRSVIAARSWF